MEKLSSLTAMVAMANAKSRSLFFLFLGVWLGCASIVTPASAVTLNDGDILVADSSGKVIRVDPATGAQTIVSSGGFLVATHGITVFVNPVSDTIAKTFLNGPRVDDGTGTLVDLVALAGLITGSNDHGSIDVGRLDSQFYEFKIDITNDGTHGVLDDAIVSDPIPDTYDLDPLCGDDPVAASTSCDPVGGGTFVDRDSDTFADGIINDTPAKCTVSSSTSEGGKKKGGAGLEPEFVTIIIDNLLAGETCMVRVFVRTDENPAKKTALFEPVACRDLDSGVFDTIPLNEGVKMFDPITGDRLLGPLGSLQLTPNNCP